MKVDLVGLFILGEQYIPADRKWSRAIFGRKRQVYREYSIVECLKLGSGRRIACMRLHTFNLPRFINGEWFRLAPLRWNSKATDPRMASQSYI
jgi:hypothetical protein